MDEEAFLRGDIPSAYDKPTVITANPGSTDSEFDAKDIVYPPGSLVHQPAGELVGTGGGNGGNGNDDDRYWRNARWGALGEIPNVFSDLFGKSEDLYKKDYTEGAGTKLIRMPDGSVRRVPIETEEPGSSVISQDGVLTEEVLQNEGETASEIVNNFLDKSQWLDDTRNSPAAKSGAFTDDQRWQQQLRHREWQKENNRGPYRVQDNPDTPNNEAHEAARAARFNRRNQRLIDKGLKPINLS
tara:strand:- start:266 stop:991 length:726 start_codon:yes stop_codon:yes gene_type:complete